jgi:uncharacterized membrane protein
MFGYGSWCSSVFGSGTGSYGWWIVCFIAMVLMVGLCIFFMMSMMRRWKGGTMCCLPLSRKAEGTGYTPSDSARDILDKRYAAGGINREEYEERKRNLNPASDT